MASPEELYPSLTRLMSRPMSFTPAQPQRSAIGAGISSGIDQLQGLGGAAIGMVGNIFGSDTVKTFGEDIARRNFEEAAQNGRPDLEGMPDSLGEIPAWLGYQTFKTLPTLAAVAAASRIPGVSGLGRYLPQSAKAAGAYVPQVLGGGGARLGAAATFGQQRAGVEFANRMAAITAASYPIAAGSNYASAMDAGDVSQGEAIQAAIAGVPSAALEAIQPRQLEAFLKTGLQGNIGRRLATGIAAGAAVEAPVEAAQTAIEMAFRPDLSVREKMSNIVDAAVTGGAVGGVLGGVAGIRRMKTADPAQTSTDDIKTVVDQELGLTQNQQGQTEAFGEQAAPRPFGARDENNNYTTPVEELERRLAELQQRKMFENEMARAVLAEQPEGARTGMAPIERNKQDTTLIELLRAELDARAAEQRPQLTEDQQAELAALRAQEDTRTVAPGPMMGRSPLVEDTLNVTPQARARMAELEQGQVEADTGLYPSNPNQGLLDLRDPITGQRSPERVPLTETQQQARSVATALMGNSRSMAAQNIANMPAEDGVDVVANIITEVGARDNSTTKKLPAFLLKAAQTIGLYDSQGRPRDLDAEIADAEKRNSELWQRARATGQGVKQAQQYQNSTLKELRATRDTLRAAEKRLAARQAIAADQQSNLANLTEADVQMLRDAPPARIAAPDVEAGSMRERFAAGPIPVPAADAQVGDTRDRFVRGPNPQSVRFRQGSMRDRFARGPAPQAAPDQQPGDARDTFLRGRVPIPAMDMESGDARSTFAAGPPPRPAQGVQPGSLQERFARGPAPQETQVEAGSARARFAAGPTPVPAADAQTGDTRDRFARGPAPQAAAGIQPGSAQEQIAQQAKVAKLAEIAQSDVVSQELRNAASEAQAMAESFAPGADSIVDDVLAEYAERTGDIVFSRRPTSQARPPLPDDQYDAALMDIARKLPRVARENIFSVSTASELPGAILRAAERQGMTPNEIRGVLYDGKVYVVQDQVSSVAELQEVIAHEVFGHGAARALFGESRVENMATIFRWAGGLEGLRSLARTFGVEKALNEYLPGRDLTERDQADLVDELLSQVAGKQTGKFSMFLRTFASRIKSGIIRLLRGIGLTTAAERIETFDANDLAELLSRMRTAVEQGNPMDGEGVVFLRTPAGMQQSVKNAVESFNSFDKLMSQYKSTGFSDEFNRLHLYTSTTRHISEFFGDMFRRADGTNILNDWANMLRGRLVTEQRLAHMSRKSYLAYEKLQAEKPEAAKRVGELMGDASYREIDGRKTWEQHTWLTGLKSADTIKTYWVKANTNYRWLRQNSPAGVKVYEDFVAGNEMMNYAQQALMLYNLLLKDGSVTAEAKSRLKNPMDKFMDQPQIDDPVAARDFWFKEINALTSFTKEYLKAQNLAPALNNKGKVVGANLLDARLKEIEAQQQTMERAPYFHIGRFGDYAVSFKVRRLDDKSIDQAAMTRVAQAFEDAKIDNVMFPTNARNASVFIRFESKGAQEEAKRIVAKLQAEGLISDSKAFNRQDTMEDASGYVSQQVRSMMDEMASTYFGGDLELDGEQKKVADTINRQIKNQMTQIAMNMLPDISSNKVLVSRKFVTGFSPDHVRSYVFRNNVGARALANLYTASKISNVSQELRAIVREARNLDSPRAKSADTMQRVVNELFIRESQRPAHVRSNFVDMLRASAHTFFLGLSPSYVFTQITALNTMLWPELAKKHGFVNSAKVIAKQTAPAYKIIQAVLADSWKNNKSEMADATITRELLVKNQKKIGLTNAQIDFVMRGVNAGWIDIGTQSRELGRVAEGGGDSKVELALRWGAAAGYYSEMFTRLVAALSARELHGGTTDDMFKYAENVVNQTMFSFDPDNIARATGRDGVLSQFTPLFVQFQQYIFSVTEKLIREFHTAFTKDVDAATKREARRFLGAHLVGMTAVAGTLGLPMAATVAKVIDSLADLLGDDDDEPFNVMAAYRNWLNMTFGPEIGNVVARGLPRAFGFDISKRVGEQDLFPFIQSFSKVLTDRRNWEDSFNDWASNAGGAAFGAGINILSGGQMMFNGEYMDGAIRALPTLLNAPLKAWKLTTDGYVDKKGNAMPMSSDAADILYQLFGFTPAARADYFEQDAAQSSLRSDMSKRASRLRKNLATAIEDGDRDAARSALQAAREFDANFPDYAILPNMEGVLKRRARERALAEKYGTGLGVKPQSAEYTSFFDPQNY